MARRISYILFILLFAAACLQCQSLPYYDQAINGHTEILRSRESISDLIDDPAQAAARAAPGGPAIQQNQTRVGQHLLLKGAVGHRYGSVARGQWSATFSTNRPFAGSVRGYAVFDPAAGAGQENKIGTHG